MAQTKLRYQILSATQEVFCPAGVNYSRGRQKKLDTPEKLLTNLLSSPIRDRPENLESLKRLVKRGTKPRINKQHSARIPPKTPPYNINKYAEKIAENEELNITLARLQALLEEEEEDDYGVAKPSAYAYGTVLALVSEASRLMTSPFRKASASTDDRGGIRLTWSRPEAELRLVCAHQSDKPTYLYHEVGNEYEVERDVSVSTVARWLDWLNNI